MSGSLFPGWRPDAAGRERLAVLAASLATARPADGPRLQMRRPDQWHVTLCFLGRDQGHVVGPALRDGLAGVAARIAPHVVQIGHLQYWSRAGVVVALPRDPTPLQHLCDGIDAAVRACGIVTAQPTTRPHITLAHTRRGLDALPWLASVAAVDDPLHVDGFELLTNPGNRYEPLGQWRLAGAGADR